MTKRTSEGSRRMAGSFVEVVAVGAVKGVMEVEVITRVYMCSKSGVEALRGGAGGGGEVYAGLLAGQGGQGGVFLEDHGAP